MKTINKWGNNPSDSSTKKHYLTENKEKQSISRNNFWASYK